MIPVFVCSCDKPTIIFILIYVFSFEPSLEKKYYINQAVVKGSDNLSSPNFKILSVLQESRRKGCNAYIILLANPTQTTNLLVFGDRFRELDTRAKFLFVHDKRLFAKEFHYLWNKLINVVFLRKFIGTKRYELSTVPFPTPIGDILFPKRLDTWSSGKMQRGVDLYRDKTEDLQKQVLRVVTFSYIPSAIKKPSAVEPNETSEQALSINKYEGLEIMMLLTLSEAMRFQPEIMEATGGDKEAWGRLQPDGSWSGLIGVMSKGNAELALASLHQSPLHLAVMDLTVPYTSHCLTFLTPESTSDNSWKTLILPFPGNMWLSVFSSLLLIAFSLSAIANLSIRFTHTEGLQPPMLRTNAIQAWTRTDLSELTWKDKIKAQFEFMKWAIGRQSVRWDSQTPEWSSSLLNTWSMLLQVSLTKLPEGMSLRVMIGFAWLYFVLIANAYKAAMTAILANPPPRVTIDNLEELAKSSIDYGGWGEQNRELLLTSLDTAGRIIGKKFKVLYDSEQGLDMVAEGMFAYYENIYFLKHAIAKRQNRNASADTGKRPNMHIMSSCVINMPISVGLSKNSPLKPRVDSLMRRLVEAGLVNKWLSDITSQSERSIIEANQDGLVNLKKLYGSLVVLVIGYFIGCSALSVELLYWHYQVKNNPDFDKYALQLYNKK